MLFMCVFFPVYANLTVQANSTTTLSIWTNVSRICIGPGNIAPSLGAVLQVESNETEWTVLQINNTLQQCFKRPFSWTFKTGLQTGNTTFDIDYDNSNIETIVQYQVTVMGK